MMLLLKNECSFNGGDNQITGGGDTQTLLAVKEI